jgi:hypothetical protein
VLPVTPRPYEPRRMRLQRTPNIGWLLSVSRSVVALRIELSAPWLSAEDGQPALDYRVVLPAARMGIEPISPP